MFTAPSADPATEVREYLQQRDDARRAVDAAVARDFYNVLDQLARILCSPHGERAALARLRSGTRRVASPNSKLEPEPEPEPEPEVELFAQYMVLAQQTDLDETTHAVELHRAKLQVMSMRKEVSDCYRRIDDALDHRRLFHDEISANITDVVEEALRALDQRLFHEHSAKQSDLRSRMVGRLDTQRNSAREEIMLRESALSAEARQMLKDNNSEWEHRLQDIMNAHEAAKQEWKHLLQQTKDDLILARNEFTVLQKQHASCQFELARRRDAVQSSAEEARNILRKGEAQLEAEKQQRAELQQALEKLRRENSLKELQYSKACSELESQKSLVRAKETVA
eukprot:COSAG02_NODE_7955_length_2773_cov_1.461855_1_plen_340_part_00